MNKTCDIVYRVDGGRNLGYGHIFRSISIENDLKNYFKFKFLVIKDKAGLEFSFPKIKSGTELARIQRGIKLKSVK